MAGALKLFLELADDLDVVGMASNGLEAISLCRELRPHVVLMDLSMPVLEGVSATRRISAEMPDIKVVVVTTFASPEAVVPALRAGASGYLLKDTEPDMLLGQLADVMTGKQILSEPLRPYLENIYELDHLQQKLESLTRREMQIMREIAKGLSNKQVASVLHISEGTVKVHVKSLLKKLEAQSRVEAAVMYLEQRN